MLSPWPNLTRDMLRFENITFLQCLVMYPYPFKEKLANLTTTDHATNNYRSRNLQLQIMKFSPSIKCNRSPNIIKKYLISKKK